MNVSEMFESKYLKKEDLKGPVVAIISNVTMEMLKDQSGVQKKKGILHLAGGQLKPIILNVGNTKTLTNLYGTETNNWLGKPIEIYVNPAVEMGGQMVGGLRLRPPSGPPQNGHAPQAGYGPSLMNWQMAVAALKGAGIAEDMLKQVLTRKGFTGYRADRDTATVLAMIEEAKHSMQPSMSQEESFDTIPEGEVPF